MAALYLHHALYTPDTDSHSPEHTRSYSVATLLNSVSDHSHPTEHLLNSATLESHAYHDIISRQPTHPDGPTPGWDLGLNLLGDQPTAMERKTVRDRTIRRRIRRFRAVRSVLEVVIVAWASYTTIRYFIAFADVSTSPALSLSISLGVVGAMSAALPVFAFLIPKLYHHHSFPYPRVLIALRTASAFLFLVPAIVNIAVLFTDRVSLHVSARCHWDVDVVWSDVPGSLHCPSTSHHPSFAAWVAAASVRLVFTFVVATFYLYVSHTYQLTRRPSSYRRRIRTRYSVPRPYHHPSYSVDDDDTLAPTSSLSQSQSRLNSGSNSSSKSTFFTLPRSRSQSHSNSKDAAAGAAMTIAQAMHSSSSTLVPGQSSPPANVAAALANGSASTRTSPSSNTIPLLMRQISSPISSNANINAYASSSSPSADNLTPAPTPRALRRTNPIPAKRLPSNASDEEHLITSSPISASISDADLSSFASRFRAIVSQVARETSEGLRVAHASHSSRGEYSYDGESVSDEEEEEEGVTWSCQGLDPGSFSRDFRDPYDEFGLGLQFAAPPDAPSSSFASSPFSYSPASASYSPFAYPAASSHTSNPRGYPDVRIPMLGKSVQRMPTIESFGSREAPSSVHATHSPRSSLRSSAGPSMRSYAPPLSPAPSMAPSAYSSLTANTNASTTTTSSMPSVPSIPFASFAPSLSSTASTASRSIYSASSMRSARSAHTLSPAPSLSMSVAMSMYTARSGSGSGSVESGSGSGTGGSRCVGLGGLVGKGTNAGGVGCKEVSEGNGNGRVSEVGEVLR